MAASSSSDTSFAESVAAYGISPAASTERVSAAANRAGAAEVASNAETARAAVHTTDVALVRVEAIHAKIFQATSASSMQPTSEKAVEAMGHLLPHEIAERELDLGGGGDLGAPGGGVARG
ncbi:hypothetical protein ZWY2020_010797 [Hordeum vulgare]|nr:hypothetical protein ZWY2020_010797 [Hordeum vulgare]